MNTGVPMRENDSASTCRVTVLPVPVAPVIQPCRFAKAGNRASSVCAFLAMRMGLGMDDSDQVETDAQVSLPAGLCAWPDGHNQGTVGRAPPGT